MTHTATYPRFLADRYYWRRKAIKAGLTGICICPDCHGSGVVPVLNTHGDDIDYDTCTRCAPLFVGADWTHETDPTPF